MHRITPTASRRCVRNASIQLVITFTLALFLLAAASPVAASPAESRRMEGLPPLTSVAPWAARCYTDTCVGLRVTFDSGHAVALGHAADDPYHWAIFFASTDLTVDEAAFAEATVSALERRDLPALVAAYPAIPSWYRDSLAAYMVSDHPVYRLWLPLLTR